MVAKKYQAQTQRKGGLPDVGGTEKMEEMTDSQPDPELPWSVGGKFGARQSLSASALETGFVRSSLNRFSESREVTFQFVLQSLVVKL